MNKKDSPGKEQNPPREIPTRKDPDERSPLKDPHTPENPDNDSRRCQTV